MSEHVNRFTQFYDHFRLIVILSRKQYLFVVFTVDHLAILMHLTASNGRECVSTGVYPLTQVI